jgi:hypothetical protein
MSIRIHETIESDEGLDHTLLIQVTDEGLIIDAFNDGEISGTFGKTFEELYDWLSS